MISAVIATFNSMKYINKQFDSILNQTITVDEVIIVDDFSSDNTVEYIENYINSNALKSWRLFRHHTNLGYIETFREGLSLANGEIIIICDHDDIWMKNKVEIINKTFIQDPSILYLATKFVQIDETDNVVPIRTKCNRANNNLIKRSVKKGFLNKMNLKDIAIYNIAPGCACALSSTLKDAYISSDVKILPHDWALALIAAYHDGLYYLDSVTTKYRIHSKNTIGLRHESRYSYRVRSVKKNLVEKKEMLRFLVNVGADTRIVKYYHCVNEIFNKRVVFLESKNIVGLILLTIVTFQYRALYESLIFDSISILNGDI